MEREWGGQQGFEAFRPTRRPDRRGHFRHGMSEEEDQIGAVTGLAWTEVGGELLTIEAVTVPGKGQIKTTGKLGDVMQESIQAAFSFVRARAPSYGVKPSVFLRKDIHVHLPEGAVPKDGPSAGIGMVTAIISTLSGIPVRRDVSAEASRRLSVCYQRGVLKCKRQHQSSEVVAHGFG